MITTRVIYVEDGKIRNGEGLTMIAGRAILLHTIKVEISSTTHFKNFSTLYFKTHADAENYRDMHCPDVEIKKQLCIESTNLQQTRRCIIY